MGPIIVACVVVGIAGIIVIQSAVDRRRVARTRLRLPSILAERLADHPATIDVRRLLTTALARTDQGVDVYDRVSERVDLSRFRPKLAHDIEFKRFPLRWGNDYAMVANPRAMVYFRLEPWEADLVLLMDGTRTVGEIIVDRLEEEGDFHASGATELVQILSSGGSWSRFRSGLLRASREPSTR